MKYGGFKDIQYAVPHSLIENGLKAGKDEKLNRKSKSEIKTLTGILFQVEHLISVLEKIIMRVGT